MESLAGRYTLEERLGTGGTAVVWRATDTSLNVARAVKVLHVAHGPQRDALRERLHTEARAMAQLSHPGVVSVHDVGVDGDRDFIVMDLIDGESLADRLDRDGPMELAAAVRLGVQILEALAAAHAVGIVHRDVKPGNVLLDASGSAHLCDFGIALAKAADDRQTRTGTALGSLPYMAPEQRRDARTVGPEADLYSVGCTLYFALTCATPVDLYLAPGRSPRWATVPDAIVPVLRRATSADPGDRYESAAAMARALVVAAAPPVAEPEVPLEVVTEAEGPGRRRMSALWVNLTLLVVAILVSVAVVYQLDHTVTQPVIVAPPEPEVVDAMDMTGTWIGPLDGQQPGIRLVLSGDSSALVGTVELQLGPNKRHSQVTGTWDDAAGRLTLSEPDDRPGAGVFVAEIDDVGVLRGEFRRHDGTRTVSFALVRES